MSVCPSSAGNCQPCSQSQKMSIGIFVEEDPKPVPGSMKKADVSKTRREKRASAMEPKIRKHIQRGVKASISSTMCKNDFQEDSVRVVTGSLATNMPTKDSRHAVSHASTPTDSCLRGEQPTHTMQFANRSLSGSVVDKKTEADGISEKENRKVFMHKQQFATAPKQQVCLPVNDELHTQPKELENKCKETLRMKLREILGAVPSNENISGDIRTHEMKAEETTREQTLKDDDIFMPRQSSDTIETDSENVELTIKKLVTRSFARKRVPAKTRPKNLKSTTMRGTRKGHQGSDIFSFSDKSAPSPPCPAENVSLIAEKTVYARKRCGFKPGDNVSPVIDSRGIQSEVFGCEKAQPVEELSLRGGVASLNHDCLEKNQHEASMQNSFLHIPVARENNISPNTNPQERSENLEQFGGHSPLHHVDGLNCQLPEVTKVMLDSPMGPDLPTNNKEQHAQESVQLDRGVVEEAEYLYKNSTASEKENSEFSDDVGTLRHSQISNSTPSDEEMDAGNDLFIPSRGELDSAEEVSIAKKVYEEVEDVYTDPEISFFGKATLFRSKRHCCHDIEMDNQTPTLHTPKVSENADVSTCFDDTQEDGSARVVSLLGKALEKIKSKLLLVRNKRCSEILMSAAEEIRLQLHTVQSQIQSDLEKLSSLKLSKRKHFEARLQEQLGHLKIMHEKFKEEISRYVQDCKGAVEGLETQHIELQGAIEKQKAVHRKLLSQTEAAVETHLIDAHKQMMSVHKLEKQKMQSLKLAIAECLKDTC